MSAGDVTLALTEPQARVLHEVLSVVENDPTWLIDTVGQRDANTLARVHDQLRAARRVSKRREAR